MLKDVPGLRVSAVIAVDAGGSCEQIPLAANLGGMDEFEVQLSDVVLFELPTFEAAQAFRVRLRSRWPGWSHDDDQVWLFAAELGAEVDDLALLLREAQELLAELGVPAVVFVLDGRSYILDRSEPVYEPTEKQAA